MFAGLGSPARPQLFKKLLAVLSCCYTTYSPTFFAMFKLARSRQFASALRAAKVSSCAVRGVLLSRLTTSRMRLLPDPLSNRGGISPFTSTAQLSFLTKYVPSEEYALEDSNRH